MKSKLYVSKNFFKESPHKSFFAMMEDGEIFFYQFEENADIKLNNEWEDLKEVAQIDTEDVLQYKKLNLEQSDREPDEEMFMRLTSKYENNILLIHPLPLKKEDLLLR